MMEEGDQDSLGDDILDFLKVLFYGPPKSKKATEKKEKLSKAQRKKEKDKIVEEPSENATEEDLKNGIHVVSVDLNINVNTKKHRTDKYECTRQKEGPELVVRRGQNFKLSVTFDREYNIEHDDLKFVFKTGNKFCRQSNATFGKFKLNESGKGKPQPNGWSAKLIKREGNTLHTKVHSPSNCAVGDFSFSVITLTKTKDKPKKRLRYEHPDDITILFNPWCKDDQTYYPEVHELDEYVLNDHGCVYRGNKYMPQAKEWNFGQFEDGILEASLFLAQKCFNNKNMYQMADPVTVARKIAAVVNCNDSDNGVLVGNWSGCYEGEGCTDPSDWYGSVRILKKYMETLKPVCYGQCWVFSGVTTTVCRALGLPARSVTNYGSAHDTDKSNTIDIYYCRNSDNELERDSSSDSIWNFHVWNEVWMDRPDINCSEEDKGNYDGWQAIDATPQEMSEGVFTCGPCPVYAVKHGLVNVQYDCHFIFAEVNADEVHWECTPDGEHPFKIKSDKIGQSISTKKADGRPYDSDAWFDRSRVDITRCYKYEEGSNENQKAVVRAVLGAEKRKNVYDNDKETKDVKFKLLHDAELTVGKDIKIKLTAENKSEYRRDLSTVIIRAVRQSYTGVMETRPFFKVDLLKREEELVPKKVYEYEAILKSEDYLKHLGDERCMNLQAFAFVDATRSRPQQNCVKAHEVELVMPTLEVKIPKSVKQDVEFEAVVTFNNPLQDELTNCTAGYEGRGFDHVTGVKQPDVPRNGKFEGKFKMKGGKKGTFTLTFKFSSKRLKHLSGSATVTVE